VNDFAAWGQYFSDGDVGFQYGYARDKKWWKNLSDPPGDIGNEILNNVSNATDLFWVDFTAYDIWPEGSAMAKETSYDEACAETGNSTPLTKFELYKNYPNPFNPTTTIEFSIPKTTNVRLTVFDLLGREITQLINEQKFAGKYSAVFNGSQLSNGVYIFRLEAENVVLSKKMLLVK
jgi:hypothetical protein